MARPCRVKPGMRFALLLVEEVAKRMDNGDLVFWCLCDCGVRKAIRAACLKPNGTISCGCMARGRPPRHGMTESPTWRSWRSAISRCENKNNVAYQRYGGRGITVCARWRESFENFLADMGERPDGTTLDRVDSNGNYEPGNCRWSTWREQNNNKRSSRFIEVDGERMTVAQWGRHIGVPKATIQARLRRGLTGRDALYGTTVKRAG